MLNNKSGSDVFQAFFEAAPDALFLVDADGLIQEANLQASEMFGYAHDELLGQPIELLLPEESRDVHVTHRQGFVKQATVRKMGSDLELFGRTRSGRLFPIDVSLSPLERHGKTMVATAVRDFSEQKAIEVALRLANEQAQTATASKSRFLAAASHDLRQPLQSLNLYLAVLKRQTQESAVLATADKMHAALDNMGELLNALLDLSRFDGGSITPTIEDFPVAELLQHIETDNAPIAEQKGLDFRVYDGKAIIRSDLRLLQRVVENFVTNAIKYTEQGSVMVDCCPGAETLDIRVVDTGIGIEAAQIDAIFEEYMQIDNEVRDRRKGLGIGLTIAKNIARMLGHSIAVESQPHAGSTFTVTVPLVSYEDEPARPVVDQAVQENSQRFIILLVEDDPDVRDATELLLSSDGHEVQTFTDAEHVMTGIGQRSRPDLIVSDYRLPGADGLSVIDTVRQHFGSEIPAIIMTGDTTLPELEEDNYPGCVVLFKPIDTDKLLSLVSACRR